jgi:hypothetical protein
MNPVRMIANPYDAVGATTSGEMNTALFGGSLSDAHNESKGNGPPPAQVDESFVKM